jgi:hypothetical protein
MKARWSLNGALNNWAPFILILFATRQLPAQSLPGGMADKEAVAITDTAAEVINVDARHILTSGYLGNGVQWDPYELKDISPEAWKKTRYRLNFMQLAFARVMISADMYCLSFPPGGSPEYSFNNDKVKILYKILDYCQSHGVTVVLGEWGDPSGKNSQPDPGRHQLRFDGIQEYDPRWTHIATDFLVYLIREKKFTCIKYYNLGNEPNGSWMNTESFATWKTSILNLDTALKKRGLRDQIKVVGPDVSGNNEWIDYILRDPLLAKVIDAYDVHWYAKKEQLTTASLERELAHYKQDIVKNDPNGAAKPFFIGEAGMLDGRSRVLDQQKMIGTFQYGVWMADYAVQSMLAGQSGICAWSLDDAMHTAAHKAGGGYAVTDYEWKEWGLWDSYGAEKNNPGLAAVRPWYYVWSLLSRYIPAGSVILQTAGPDTAGIRSVAVKFRKDDKEQYTFVLVNTGNRARKVVLEMPGSNDPVTIGRYNYFENDRLQDADGFPVVKQQFKNIVLAGGLQFEMPAEGMVVLTTAAPGRKGL